MRKIALMAVVVLAGLASGLLAAEAAPLYTKANAPATPALGDMELKDSVSQYGITWTFAEPAPVGQFVNGEWYVVGPVTVKMIDPKPLFGDEIKGGGWTMVQKRDADGQVVKDDDGDDVYEVVDTEPTEAKDVPNGRYVRNGSVLNPPPVMDKSGFDSRVRHGRYDPALTATLPIEMKPGDALLSCRSMKALRRRGHYTPLDDLAVLTCLKAPVPPDAFRPGYMDREQVIYRASDLKRELLPTLEPVADVPDMGGLADRFAKPWYVLNVFKASAASYQYGGYGQRSCFYLSRIYLYLCLDYTAEEKDPLLRSVVGFGIDMWAVVKSGHPGFPAWGGWNSGYKMPIVVAGYLLGDEVMASPSKAFPKCAFQEDEQTAYGPCWNGANVVFTGHSGYDAATLKSRDNVRGNHMWGYFEHLHPSLWVKDQVQSDGYRRCCTSRTWPGEALAARLMGLEKYWAHDAWFDYVDRWMYQDETGWFEITSKEGHERVGWGPLKDWAKQGQVEDPFAAAMWKKYRTTLDAPTDGWRGTLKPNPNGIVMPKVNIPDGATMPILPE